MIDCISLFYSYLCYFINTLRLHMIVLVLSYYSFTFASKFKVT